MTKIYDDREKVIKRCIGQTTEEVRQLREVYQQDRDNVEKLNKLRTSQLKVLSLNEILRKKCGKIIHLAMCPAEIRLCST